MNTATIVSCKANEAVIEGSVTMTINDDDITTYVRANMSPEDVFSKEELQEWAEENGYKK